jgi:hypothetical protein
MKKIIFFLLAAAFLLSCKKDNLTSTTSPVDKIMLDGAVVISKGDLVFSPAVTQSGKTASGTAVIYRQKNSRYVLALEDMNYKTVFDMGVYLSSTEAFSAASLKLLSVKNFDQNLYFELPAGVYRDAYKYIIIKKMAAADPVATATLY